MMLNLIKNFYPVVSGGKVISFDGKTMVASVDIKKAGMNKTFTTKNALVEGKSIQLELDNGPFNYLKGKWTFIELAEDACKVEFNLDFEFSGSLVNFAFNKVFKDLMGSMVSAFTQRAKVVYGGGKS